MSDPIQRDGLSPRFWQRKPLNALSPVEWDALCDGCGKCCMNKLEDEDSREVALTNIACRLFDESTCRCAQYDIRHQFVPDCIVLTASNIKDNLYWMPETCAYRLVYEGKPLFDWHPLISGTADTVYDAGVSMQHATVPEFDVPEDEWDDYIIEEPQ